MRVFQRHGDGYSSPAVYAFLSVAIVDVACAGDRTVCHSDLRLRHHSKSAIAIGVLIGTGNRRHSGCGIHATDSTQLPVSDGSVPATVSTP